MRCWLLVALLCLSPLVQSGDLEQLERDLSARARIALASYVEPDPATRLNNQLFLQLAAGDYASALASLAGLRQDRANPLLFTQYELYVLARQQEAQGQQFDVAIAQAYRNRIGTLSARDAYKFSQEFDVDLDRARRDAETAAERPDSVELIRQLQIYAVARALSPHAKALLAADDAERYDIDRPLTLPGVALHATHG